MIYKAIVQCCSQNRNRRLDDVAEDRTPPIPCVVRDHGGWVGNEWSVVCVELACLVRRTSPLPAWTHESRVCWVSCVLSWHVLSEGQVHYRRGHTSLECVECRVCWAGTSCLKDVSCTSHRSVTAYSWSCIPDENPLGRCSPLCWSSSDLHFSSTPNLVYTPTNIILI